MAEAQTQPPAETTPPPAEETAPEPTLVIDGVDLSDMPALFRPDAEEAPPAEEPKPTQPPAEAKAPEKPDEAEQTPEQKAAAFKEVARLEKQKRELEAKLKEYESKVSDDITEDNALEVLAKKGLSLQKLVDKATADPSKVPKPKTEAERAVEELRAEVKALRESAEKERQQRVEAERAAIITDWKSKTQKALEESADEFPHLSALGADAVEEMFSVIEKHAHATGGEILDRTEVAKQLEAKYEKLAARLTGKGKPETLATSRSQPQTGSVRPPASGPRTLTNRQAAAPSPPVDDDSHVPTEEERMREAAKAIRILP